MLAINVEDIYTSSSRYEPFPTVPPARSGSRVGVGQAL